MHSNNKTKNIKHINYNMSVKESKNNSNGPAEFSPMAIDRISTHDIVIDNSIEKYKISINPKFFDSNYKFEEINEKCVRTKFNKISVH